MARKPSSVHPAAEREVAREFRYYQRAAGMGAAFLDAFALALDRACEAPESKQDLTADRDEARLLWAFVAA